MRKRSSGSSEYAKEIIGQIWGVPPALDLKQEAALQSACESLIQGHTIESAMTVLTEVWRWRWQRPAL